MGSVMSTRLHMVESDVKVNARRRVRRDVAKI